MLHVVYLQQIRCHLDQTFNNKSLEATWAVLNEHIKILNLIKYASCTRNNGCEAGINNAIHTAEWQKRKEIKLDLLHFVVILTNWAFLTKH